MRYVDDVAAGQCAALERGAEGARYVLGGENAPQSRVFELVQEITGKRRPLRIPFPVADALGAAEELRVTLFGGTPLITRGAVEIFRHDWSLDSDEALRHLGYTMTPLDEGIRRTVAELRAIVTPHSESARQWVHVGSGVFALLLRVLTWWQAARRRRVRAAVQPARAAADRRAPSVPSRSTRREGFRSASCCTRCRCCC